MLESWNAVLFSAIEYPPMGVE